ncbi:MAG: hypothetical protein EPO21_06765 [Chloroflexota bacterium]|nr:MAG: hypothetical protein EPO21_06765 [Chloroflexota bacterium]
MVSALLATVLLASLVLFKFVVPSDPDESVRAEDSQPATLVSDADLVSRSVPDGNPSPPPSVVSSTDPTRHYVLFLAGIDSWSIPGEPIYGLFGYVRDRLSRDLQVSRFVYFSYKAAAVHNAGRDYCEGWVDGCSSSEPATVRFAGPVYSVEETHLSIDDQVMALDWMLTQIVKADAGAQIDVVGYSLGGIVAARWAALRGSESALSDRIQSIILLESPVGGIPLANLIEGPVCTRFNFCQPLKKFAEGKYGGVVLRQLQVPSDDRSRSESIVPSLSQAGLLFKVTSIQSTADYLVSGTPLEFCLDASCISRGSFTAGSGSQGWPATSQTLHYEYLGGDTAPIRAEDLLSLMEPATQRLMTNHGLPLFDPSFRVQTATWIAEAVSGGVANTPSVP